jgi:hypothetical protein
MRTHRTLHLGSISSSALLAIVESKRLFMAAGFSAVAFQRRFA